MKHIHKLGALHSTKSHLGGESAAQCAQTGGSPVQRHALNEGPMRWRRRVLRCTRRTGDCGRCASGDCSECDARSSCLRRFVHRVVRLESQRRVAVGLCGFILHIHEHWEGQHTWSSWGTQACLAIGRTSCTGKRQARLKRRRHPCIGLKVHSRPRERGQFGEWHCS